MQLLAESDNDRTIDVHVDDMVRLELPENATTGYRWHIDHCDEAVNVVSTEPDNSEKAVGAGGKVAFVFRAKKVGVGEIVLKHWRDWEGDASVIARFRIRMNVLP